LDYRLMWYLLLWTEVIQKKDTLMNLI
jgi:hypothetical protein